MEQQQKKHTIKVEKEKETNNKEDPNVLEL